MKLGAEPKKLAILGGLLLLGGYSFYSNVLSGPASSPSPTPQRPAAKADVPGLPQPPGPAAAGQKRRQLYGRQSGGELRLTMKYQRPEDRPDPMKTDPTLRLDLLAKLQNVTIQGGQRTLFDFSTAPVVVPKTPDVPKIIPAAQKKLVYGPMPKPPDEVKPPDPPKPPPPPIPLKFYGFSSPRNGSKRAFFLEGEDIYVAGEGELIKKRYKVVRIGLNSVVVEDTEHKHEQTLPLEEQPVTG